MHSIRVERNYPDHARVIGIDFYCWVLLNCQNCTVTLPNHYALVFIDDILIDGTQLWAASKSERKRWFGLVVLTGREVVP